MVCSDEVATQVTALGRRAVAVTTDIRWLKNRHKVLNEVYVAPVYLRMGEAPSAVPGSGTPYALNNRLAEAAHIGLGAVEGPAPSPSSSMIFPTA